MPQFMKINLLPHLNSKNFLSKTLRTKKSLTTCILRTQPAVDTPETLSHPTTVTIIQKINLSLLKVSSFEIHLRK